MNKESLVFDYCIRYKKLTKASRIINIIMSAAVVTMIILSKKGR